MSYRWITSKNACGEKKAILCTLTSQFHFFFIEAQKQCGPIAFIRVTIDDNTLGEICGHNQVWSTEGNFINSQPMGWLPWVKGVINYPKNPLSDFSFAYYLTSQLVLPLVNMLMIMMLLHTALLYQNMKSCQKAGSSGQRWMFICGGKGPSPSGHLGSILVPSWFRMRAGWGTWIQNSFIFNEAYWRQGGWRWGRGVGEGVKGEA